MAVRRFKPTTPSLRGTRLEDRSMLSKKKPPRKLTSHKRKITGRNNQGKITVRHRGGGMKRRNRIIDFKRDKFDIPAKVVDLYFDPNRSAHLALLQYADGEKRFIIATRGMEAGNEVISGESADIVDGNAMHIKNIPSGTEVNSVESKPGAGAVYGRSAGQSILVQGADPTGKYMQIKMPSGEIRLVHGNCMATVGQIGNVDKMNVKLGKAGRKRRLGWRPSVRGLAMHAVQHPHGGGEGSGVVGQAAKDIWGNKVGTRTRNNKRTEKYIIRRRRTRRRPFAKK